MKERRDVYGDIGDKNFEIFGERKKVSEKK